MTFLVIRVRSDRGVRPKIRDTMSMLDDRINGTHIDESIAAAVEAAMKAIEEA